MDIELDFKKLDGLVPAVVVDETTAEVLMVGFMNEAAWQKTRESGLVVFYSRTRDRLWTKGETSGHTLVVKEIRTDCDADTLLIAAEAKGPGVCHEGYASCFSRKWTPGGWVVDRERAFDPQEVYGS